MKSYFFAIILCVFWACSEKYKKITEYHKNGVVAKVYFIDKDFLKQGQKIVYFQNGRISYQTMYTNGKNRDTIYYYHDEASNKLKMKKLFFDNNYTYYEDFYRNGVLKKFGVLDHNDQRIGIWKNYDEQGNLDFIKEYKAIDGKEYTNQLWVLLPAGDTLNEGVNIKYRFSKSKLKLSDSIYGCFQTDVSAFEDNAITTVSVTLPKDYTQDNFRADFSNRPKDPDEKDGIPVIEIPSRYDQKSITSLPKLIDTADYKKTVAFYWKPKRVGKDTIRGFFKEEKSFFDNTLPANKSSDAVMTMLSKNTYFEFPVEVVQ